MEVRVRHVIDVYAPSNGHYNDGEAEMLLLSR